MSPQIQQGVVSPILPQPVWKGSWKVPEEGLSQARMDLISINVLVFFQIKYWRN